MVDRCRVREGGGTSVAAYRNDLRLPWRQEERPLARKVLGEDGDHALDRPEHRAVHHHWPLITVALSALALGLVLEVKALRLHEVKLDGRALVEALESVVDLWRATSSRGPGGRRDGSPG
jgi:hypothetical protein